MLFAAIDIGTNSVRMLIANRKKNKITTVKDFLEAPRLGEGLTKSKFLNFQAINRTIIVLKKFVEISKNYNINGIRAVSTAVLREAKNADEFIEKVKNATGLNVIVVSGSKEAELVFKGVHLTSNEKQQLTHVLIDIGGGSTEVIIQEPNEEIAYSSFNIGSVKITEMFLSHFPYKMDDILAASEHISHIFRYLIFETKPLLIGLGGTVTTFSAINQQLENYDSSQIDNSRITKKKIGEIINELSIASLKERNNIIGLPRDRADIILGGGLILNELVNRTKVKSILVSEKGILYGVISEM